MRKIVSIILLSFSLTSFSQNLYFPPLTGTDWDTLSPARFGWCQERIDSLYDFLDQKNSKAFILLKDGKIVLEKYFDTFTKDSIWYWASAGKSLTSFTVGIAQQEDFLSISDTSSKYLGKGWTSCTQAQEDNITIRNQLTMTTGLDDGIANPDCTFDSCLVYKADAGSRWAYHNAPYTLLDQVISNATGMSLNAFVTARIKNKTGMTGIYLKTGDNNVFYSTPRSMARYGLLILNKGKWDSTPVLTDTAYFRQMTNTSQNKNLSYGYLWWLNGKGSYMVPQSQLVFPGYLNPQAPADMFSAIGKNGQFINVIPSRNMVFIRMGEAPGNSLVPFTLNNDIWEKINDFDLCVPPSDTTDTSASVARQQSMISVFPNPVTNFVTISLPETDTKTIVFLNPLGEIYLEKKNCIGITTIDVSALPKGFCLIRIISDTGTCCSSILIQ